ncbi:MAG: hypothetical protein JXB32_17005, partial [Deltaproteobacteria bacterium]|nr:hypothetical protein [Deltaproteobacteria bacterium]
MNPRLQTACLLLAATLGAGGCFIATTHDEYAAVRRIHQEPRVVERAQLVAEYRRNYPEGRMTGDVARLADGIDDPLFEASESRDTTILNLYLTILPEGKHAALANEIIGANSYFEERQRAAEEAERQRLAAEAQRQREWAERLKVFVHDGFRDWLFIFAETPRAWGHDLDWINHQYPLFYQYWASEPLPTCEPDGNTCRKRYEAHFSLDINGQSWERHLNLTVQLDFKDRQFFRAAIYLDRDGFTNWYELETNTVNTTDAEPYVRQTAAQYFVEYVNQLVMSKWPDGTETTDGADERVFYTFETDDLRFDVVGLSNIVGRRIDALQITN